MTPAPGRRSATFEAIRTSAKRVSAKILSPLRSTSASRARLSRVLLFYWLGLVAVIVLAPFSFSSEWLDVVARVLLFIPLGFLFPLTMQGRNPRPLPVSLLGLLLGGAIAATHPAVAQARPMETTLFVLASTLGAGVGAYILQAANHRIAHTGRLAGRLSLEIPLVALIYMLLPPLLATSLSAANDVALIPLGLLGARLIAAVYEHHFAPGGVFRQRSITGVAAGWMTLGVFPLILRDPALGVAIVALVALATWRTASIPAVHMGGVERRFEADTLRKAVPSVIAYFVIAIGLPLATGIGEWSVEPGLTGSDGVLSRQLIDLLGPIASFAMLGYLLAETRGRRELPFLKTAPRIAIECAAVALALEVSRGLQPDVGFSFVQFGAAVAASVLGAGIYHSQRERLQHILIRPVMPPPVAKLSNIGTRIAVRG